MNFHDLRIGSGGAAVNLVLPFPGRLLLLLLPLFLSRKTHIFFEEKLDGWLLPRSQNPVKVSRFHRLPR
jgi:hypothetical protein